MERKLRMAVVAAAVALFAVGTGGAAVAQLEDLPGMPELDTGGIEGPAVGELGQTETAECVRDLLDLPALNACEDAEGRVVMDLPALKLVSPKNFFDPKKPAGGGELPKTGVNVGDVAAMGMAALGVGGVFLRRLRVRAGL